MKTQKAEKGKSAPTEMMPEPDGASIFVKDFMITTVHKIQPDERVALAKLRMLRQGVGALPVVDEEGILVGIITLRDIDMAGPESLVLPVKELMTRNLVTRKRDTLLGEIVDIMMSTGLQRIPIVDGKGKLIGLVTQSTVIKSIRPLIK